jgi:hypothetical protein
MAGWMDYGWVWVVVWKVNGRLPMGVGYYVLLGAGGGDIICGLQ